MHTKVAYHKAYKITYENKITTKYKLIVGSKKKNS